MIKDPLEVEVLLERWVKWDLLEARGGIGVRGEKGDKGDTGGVGQQEPVGPQGSTGPRGVQGIRGDRGPIDTGGDPGNLKELLVQLDPKKIKVIWVLQQEKLILCLRCVNNYQSQ